MANNLLFCSQCGAQSAVGAIFCQKCGAGLRTEAVAASGSLTSGSYPAAAAPASAAIAVLPERDYGGFWIRVAAYLVDQLLLSAATLPFFLLLVFPSILRVIHEAQSSQQPPGPEIVFSILASTSLFFIIVFCGSWLYEALLTSSSWQGTVGKRILGLKVTDDFGNKISFGRSTARFFAKILSGWVMYVGFIMVAFMERKRGLHDIICSTQVLRY
ncbi:MAG: RDD family protein [Actinomycetota bacterium]